MAGERTSAAFQRSFNPAFSQGMALGARQYERQQALAEEQDQRQRVARTLQATPQYARFQDFASAVDSAERSGDMDSRTLQMLFQGKVQEETSKARMQFEQAKALRADKKDQRDYLLDVGKSKRRAIESDREYGLDRERMDLSRQKAMGDTRSDAMDNSLKFFDQVGGRFKDNLSTFAPGFRAGGDVDFLTALMSSGEDGLGQAQAMSSGLTEDQKRILGTTGIRDSLIKKRLADSYATDVRMGKVPADMARILGDVQSGRAGSALKRFSPDERQEWDSMLQGLEESGMDVLGPDGELTAQGEKIVGKAILDRYVNQPMKEEDERIRRIIDGEEYYPPQGPEENPQFQASQNAGRLEQLASQFRQQSTLASQGR